MNEPVLAFHLAVPVRDLETSVRFYVDLLGAQLGRRREHWADVWLWGCQLTLQDRPAEVRDDDREGVRHFGATLSMERWRSEVERLRAAGAAFELEPIVRNEGRPDETVKLYLRDPSGHRIELKAYADPDAALRRPAPRP